MLLVTQVRADTDWNEEGNSGEKWADLESTFGTKLTLSAAVLKILDKIIVPFTEMDITWGEQLLEKSRVQTSHMLSLRYK